ncbi:MAG: leucine-rich repeat domain-containing protein [Prevotellaceae bacterium]|jgi:hypothetical protein|nr:leucine-rich repeat domain-containing protein [Prevotellaceae bacterium]
MLKIYLENGALVFDTAEKKKLSIVSKPNLVAIGDDVKIDFTMSGIVFQQTKHYSNIEVAGTTRSSAVETVGAIGALCAGFKKGGDGSVTPPSKIITPKTITKNGVYYAAADNADGYNPITIDVESKSSFGQWQPHPDWWDIEQIFKDDPDPNKRFIVLLSDSLNTFVFNNAQLGNTSAYYRTSDGCVYAASEDSFIHTFDLTKDKPCANGYRTRWIMVYSADKSVVCNLKNADNNYSVYIYAGGSSLSSITAIKSIAVGETYNSNKLLEAFVLGNYAQLEPNAVVIYAFLNCSSLQRADILGSKIISTGAFQGCNSLTSIKLGSGTTTIQNGTFLYCASLKSININDSTIATIASSNIFNGCETLMAFITQDNFTAPANLNLSACLKFPENSAIDLFNRLAPVATARTITFGSTLLNRWSPTTKQIATDKGYTLA